MKMVCCWNDLREFGLDCLTGEACGLTYRILFDVTEKGRRFIGKCFGITNMTLAEAWNRGSQDDPHVGSIMLSSEMLIPMGIFALLENGCTEVWLMKDDRLVGFNGDEYDARFRALHANERLRSFSYGGTAGDRNVHQFSGRVT